MPKSELLQAQSKLGTRGEAILEAAPQLGLQCYIVLLSLSSEWSQWFSIITSILSLPIPLVEQHCTARSEEPGLKSIFKIALLPAALFRILTVSIILVFFSFSMYSFFIIVGHWVVLAVCILITTFCSNMLGEMGENWTRDILECVFLSWLTITNLERGKTAALCRLVSTFYWTIAHTITLVVILSICDTNPGNVKLSHYDGETFYWSDLALVQDLSTLNTLLPVTICLGWLSLVLDVIAAAVQHKCYDNAEEQEKSFWDGAVLLEGFRYRR